MPSAVFFDIGDTLGTVTVEHNHPPRLRLTLFAQIPGILTDLRQKQCRLGIISNTGQEPASTIDRLLEEASILEYFEPTLRVYSSVVKLEKNRDYSVFTGFWYGPRGAFVV